MKNKITALAAVCALAAAYTGNAQTISVPDRYYGAQDSNDPVTPDEFIGDQFKIYSMDVTFDEVNDEIGVKVFAKYFKSDSLGHLKTFPGDLFISQGYSYTGTTYFGSGYSADTYDDKMGFPGGVGSTPAEDWEYVAKLNGTSMGGKTTSGTISIYAVDPSNIYTSDQWLAASGNPAGSEYRKFQEVAYVPDSGEIALGTGSWTIGFDLSKPIEERFWLDMTLPWLDEFKTQGFADEGFGMHWAISCANDVIEGWVTGEYVTVIPEPSSVALAGAGLLGLLVAVRRRR